ncbi:hypothetical protein QMK17_15520 [Rhodococcus sp. G-MC3]|uniref:hypothetical protein n=1 Tax=Rhodococcus sp. G-MC3 TaxID=3046209 RepID=UPI0024BBCBAD|nr:hypothetical protein [Rhodococcus sp. G-MC3]MDJ0394734.1 hypothetical protein [Rhodococcus sp. G-MC3]
MKDVPADMDSVVRRWFTAGADVIDAGRRAAPAGVFITGTSGSGVGAVADELDFLAGAAVRRAPDAASAAVVLFVLDASAPLGRAALADLAPVLESTTTGLLVNKIDVHRNWRDVQRAVSEAVDEHVPRSVDVAFLPTSAKLAERARIAFDPKMRAALAEESGLRGVLRFVEAGLGQSDHVLRERKYNAAVRDAAAGARGRIVDKARAVTGVGATVGLRAERARLIDVRDRGRAERAGALRNRLQLTRSDTIHDIDEHIREFGSAARESIDTSKRSGLGHLQDDLSARLARTVSGLDSRLTDRLQAIDDDLGLSADLLAPADSTVVTLDPPMRRTGVEDKMMIVVGASAGVGLGRIVVSPLSMVPAFDIAAIPVSLVLGAFCAWWLVRSRRLVADRAHTRTWVADAAASAKSSLEQRALARMLAAETALAAADRSTALSASVAAESELERLDAELRAVADHRASVLAACDRDLSTLDRGVEKFGGRVRAVPSR